MTDNVFISHAQNAEDVVLWRALGHLGAGRYVEVGANDPAADSITKSFYDLGWHGLAVEPVSHFADRLRAERPRDTVAEVAVTTSDSGSVDLHVIDNTGLSTLDEAVGARHADRGWPSHVESVPARRLDSLLAEHGYDSDVAFCAIDVEGSERTVLESVDLTQWRPWVLVVESTAPLTTRSTHEQWEHLVLDAGYVFCLFDGLSRFYVAQEHAPTLQDALSRPATVLDGFRRQRDVVLEHAVAAEAAKVRALEAERDTLLRELVRWRGRALDNWAMALDDSEDLPHATAGSGREAAHLRAELEATRNTLSWKVTKPLRAVRARQLGAPR